jgi:hypothetical protein
MRLEQVFDPGMGNMVERRHNSIRSWVHRLAVVLSVFLAMSLLSHDIGMALEMTDGAPEASASAFTAAAHPHIGADAEKNGNTCHADDHSSVLTGQQRPELPVVLTEPDFPPLAPSHLQTTLPSPAPPPTASALRIMLQVFLN